MVFNVRTYACTQWQLQEALRQTPMLDAHTHLTGGRLAARGLHDILLYHMVVSDLYAAGCPSGGAADGVSRLAHARGGPRPAPRGDSLSAAHPEHELLLGRADHPPRSVRLERADHGRQLAAARRDDPRAGRRPRPGSGRSSAGRTSPQLTHRTGPARRPAPTTTSCTTRWNGRSSRAPSGASSTRRSTNWSAAGASRPAARSRTAPAAARRRARRSARSTTCTRPWRISSANWPRDR